MSVFRERFSCNCDRWGLYRFYRALKILSCGVLGLLEVSASAILCHGSLCYLPRYSHLVTLVLMLRFDDCRGLQLLRMGQLVYNLLDYVNLGDLLARSDADQAV